MEGVMDSDMEMIYNGKSKMKLRSRAGDNRARSRDFGMGINEILQQQHRSSKDSIHSKVQGTAKRYGSLATTTEIMTSNSLRQLNSHSIS